MSSSTGSSGALAEAMARVSYCCVWIEKLSSQKRNDVPSQKAFQYVEYFTKTRSSSGPLSPITVSRESSPAISYMWAYNPLKPLYRRQDIAGVDSTKCLGGWGETSDIRKISNILKGFLCEASCSFGMKASLSTRSSKTLIPWLTRLLPVRQSFTLDSTSA